MWKWLEEFYEVRRNHKERISVCLSCEVLKIELSNARRTVDILLNRVLNPPQPQEVMGFTNDPVTPLLKHKPWKVKQQELELADRKEAQRIMTEFKNKVSPINVENLEKQMGIVNE